MKKAGKQLMNKEALLEMSKVGTGQFVTEWPGDPYPTTNEDRRRQHGLRPVLHSATTAQPALNPPKTVLAWFQPGFFAAEDLFSWAGKTAMPRSRVTCTGAARLHHVGTGPGVGVGIPGALVGITGPATPACRPGALR